MKTLVLGGTGFIGSHVVDRLKAGGHQVRVLSRGGERFRSALPGVDYLEGDITVPEVMREAVAGMDVAFHLVSTTLLGPSNRDPIADIESNLLPAVRLLQEARENRVRKIVFLSSGGTVYGVPQKLPIPEDHPLHPICSYGVVKVAVENYLHMYHELYGQDYVVIRASNPYGERQGQNGGQGVIGTFLHKIFKGESLDVWGDGSLVRDFVRVEDLAELCVTAGESDKVGIYNGGSGEGASIRDILQYIEKSVGRELAVNWLKSRNFDVPEVVLDISKARRDFSWDPQNDLGKGISDTWRKISSSSASIQE